MTAIVTILLRKMANNGWMVLCLLAGMVMFTSLTSSMPLYKDAILQRMLHKDLEQFYVNTGSYGGNLYAKAVPGFRKESADRQSDFLHEIDAFWEELFHKEQSRFTVLEYIKVRQTPEFSIVPTDPSRVNADISREASLVMRTDLFKHVRLADGRFPEASPKEGVFEAVVTDSALAKLSMMLGNEFVIRDNEAKGEIRIKPVGVIAEADLNDLYWNQSMLKPFDHSFFLDETLFSEQIVEEGKLPVHSAFWFTSFDYTKLDLDSAYALAELKTEAESFYQKKLSFNGIITLPAADTLERYKEREHSMRSMLWSLSVPLYILLAFYMFMVSRLWAERQQTAMAMLRSRGAGTLQIVSLFAAESALLAFAAFAVGPLIGVLFTHVLGASDSFLGFVQRKALHVEITSESYRYSAFAACCSFALTLVPVQKAAGVSIVDQKQAAAREERSPLWQKLGLDAVALGLSAYGWYVFDRRVEDVRTLGLDGSELSGDPLLFVVPSLFILGFGLLILRLYPLAVKAVFWIGKRFWPPSFYSTLLQVGRKSGQYQAFMMFLVLTAGTGLFHASAARTVNTNMEERLWYRQGSDIVIRQYWVDDAIPVMAEESGATVPPINEKVHYLEPPFHIFEQLPGVAAAARVFTKDAVQVQTGDSVKATAVLIGIETDRFGNTAWMKDGLLPYHLYEYLNLISVDPNAVLISTSLAKRLGVGPGDELSVRWNGTEPMAATVYGTIDYFPTFDPSARDKESAEPSEDGKEQAQSALIVGHLETVQNELALEPYDVWLRMESSEAREEFFKALEEKKIPIETLRDTYEAVLDSRNDPFRMAMNGVMSLSFTLSLVTTFAGFLLFWILTLKGRTYQLGLFRSMGITFRETVGMLSLEQALTSGAGFAIGIAGGTAASIVFVPLFQLTFDLGRGVPPFHPVIETGDSLRLVFAIFLMIVAALFILGLMLKKLKIHQAVKLGEE